MPAWLIGSRKLLITAAVFVTSVVLLCTGTLAPDQFVELNKFVIPSFLAANLVEYTMNRKSRDSSTPNS